MAVTNVCNDQRAPSATSQANKAPSYTVNLTVTVNDANDDGGVVVTYLEANGYALFSIYSQPNHVDVRAVVQTITATRRDGSTTIWDAVVTYGSSDEEKSDQDDDGNQTNDPLSFAYAIEVSSAVEQMVAWNAENTEAFPKADPGHTTYTRTANTWGPVVNSAGTPLDPPLMREHYDGIYTFRGNAATFVAALVDDVRGKCNQLAMKFSDLLTTKYGMDATKVFDAYTLKCTEARAVFVRSNAIQYWEYTYTFRHRPLNPNHTPYEPDTVPHGWMEQILDQGVTRFAYNGVPDGKGGNYTEADFLLGMANTVPILGPDNKRIREPVLLNGAGQPNVAISPTLPADPTGTWFGYNKFFVEDFIGAQLALDIFKANA